MNNATSSNAPNANPQDIGKEIQGAIALSKIPDIIKLIPNYSGDPKILHTWISQVDDALSLYDSLKHHQIYRTWVQSIRSKIVGDAHNAMVASQVDQNLTWNAMREKLIEHFADKRDLMSLVISIPFMTQGQKSIDEFYQEMCTENANLAQKLHLDSKYRQNSEPIIDFCSSIVMNSFIDGLNKPISGFVRSSNPETLIQAYKVAHAHDQAENRAQAKNAVARNSNMFAQNQKNRNYQQKLLKSSYNSNDTQKMMRQYIPQNVGQMYVSQRSQPQNAQRFVPNFQNAQGFVQNPPSTQTVMQNPQNAQRFAQNPQKSFSGNSRQSMPKPMSGISYRSNQMVNAIEETEEVLEEAEQIIDGDECDVEQYEDDGLNFHLVSLEGETT